MGVKVREIREMGAWIRAISDKTRKATARALLRTAVAATNRAKLNARDAFKGTADRPKTGALLNSIFAGFTMTGQGDDRRIASALVGVRSLKGDRGTRPYGRIHEYGGRIKPVRAKNLWIPQTGPKTSGVESRFRDMSPRDFMAAFLKARKTGKSGHTYKTAIRGAKGKSIFGRRKYQTKAMKGTFVILPSGVAGFVQRFGRGKSAREKFIALFVLRKFVDMPARPYVTPAVEAEFPAFAQRFQEELAKVLPQDTGGPPPHDEG